MGTAASGNAEHAYRQAGSRAGLAAADGRQRARVHALDVADGSSGGDHEPPHRRRAAGAHLRAVRSHRHLARRGAAPSGGLRAAHRAPSIHKYEQHGGPGVAECLQAISERSANPVADRRAFVEMVWANPSWAIRTRTRRTTRCCSREGLAPRSGLRRPLHPRVRSRRSPLGNRLDGRDSGRTTDPDHLGGDQLSRALERWGYRGAGRRRLARRLVELAELAIEVAKPEHLPDMQLWTVSSSTSACSAARSGGALVPLRAPRMQQSESDTIRRDVRSARDDRGGGGPGRRLLRAALDRRLPDRARRARLEHHDPRAPPAVEPRVRKRVVEPEGRPARHDDTNRLCACSRPAATTAGIRTSSPRRRPMSRRCSPPSRRTVPAFSGAEQLGGDISSPRLAGSTRTWSASRRAGRGRSSRRRWSRNTACLCARAIASDPGRVVRL